MKKKASSVSKAPATAKKKHLVREHLVTFALNEPEFKVLEKYCSKYKISNRSRIIRESLMKNIMSRMVEDYPKLFEENEMR